MTKKQRTVLFVIISTLVSVLIMIGLLFLFLFLTFAFLDGEAAVIVSFISFIMAMFGIYSGFMGFKSRGEYLVDLEDIRGASNARPYISAAFLVFMFSLIGMPPMSGFLGLIYIINNLISSHGWLMLGMVLLSLLLMSNAYLQLIRKIYFEPQNLSFDRTDKAIYICLLVNIILVATTMINPSFLFKDAAKVLSGGF